MLRLFCEFVVQQYVYTRLSHSRNVSMACPIRKIPLELRANVRTFVETIYNTRARVPGTLVPGSTLTLRTTAVPFWGQSSQTLK